MSYLPLLRLGSVHGSRSRRVAYGGFLVKKKQKVVYYEALSLKYLVPPTHTAVFIALKHARVRVREIRFT